MSERVYKVVDKDGYEYWLDDPAEITRSFGTVAEVTQYDLMNPLDVTAQINGDYML
jgi:hypothetical protein